MYISWLLLASVWVCALQGSPRQAELCSPAQPTAPRRAWEAPQASEQPLIITAQHLCKHSTVLVKWGFLKKPISLFVLPVTQLRFWQVPELQLWFTTSSWVSPGLCLRSFPSPCLPSLSFCKFVHLYNTFWLIYHIVKILKKSLSFWSKNPYISSLICSFERFFLENLPHMFYSSET